jgi:DNA-binding NtrC family response regulator
MPAAPNAGNVLIVEDDAGLVEPIAWLLRNEGYRVQTAATARKAEAVVRQGLHGVVLLDLSLPDAEGLDLFERLKSLQPKNRLVIMTAYGDLDNVVRATTAGAFDFITKANDLLERVRITVRNAFDAMAHEEQVAELSAGLQRDRRFARLLTQAAVMEPVREAIDKLAPSRVNVLVTGPSGTGKEVVARSIHEAGPRRAQPFVAVNCAGIPDTLLESELFGYERGAFTGANTRKIGKFEVAAGGTLFLDEVGEMSLALQAKLLRVLQDGRFERLGGNVSLRPDARIITATNRDLADMVRAGSFREDLFYRIAVFTIQLPSLVERKGDMALLVEHFVQLAAREEGKAIRGVAPEVLKMFEAHPWPGNVRQLQNVVARSVVACNTDQLSPRDLPASFVHEVATEPRGHDDAPGTSMAASAELHKLQSGSVADRLDQALRLAFPDPDLLPRADELEAAGIRLAIHRLGGNMQKAARRLNLSRATLYRRLDALQAAEVEPEST